MLIKVSAELTYDFTPGTQLILAIQAAHSPDQVVQSESLVSSPDIGWQGDTDPAGGRLLRGIAEGGTTIRYEAVIDNGARLLLPVTGEQHRWSDLPSNVLPYLLPSRYCPSDVFMRFAQRTFADAGDGVGKVMAVMNWVADHVDYVPGSSAADHDAEHTFTLRAGVCRDFSHLGISLCRALNIPARAVGAYALDLQPPDFHAVMEVYVAGRWWLVDPTRLAPVEGIVRIGHGRDAADIAFMTTDRECRLVKQGVAVSAA
jgi:transglutaminase-like putative cysteine protease